MSIQTVLGEIQFPADEPFREWCLPFQDLPPPSLPLKLVRFARPEFLRALDRFPIHPPVLGEVLDPRLRGELLARFEDALLLQMGLDVLVVDLHSGSRQYSLLRFCRASASLNLVVFGLRQPKSKFMADHIYKKIELVGSSPKGIE